MRLAADDEIADNFPPKGHACHGAPGFVREYRGSHADNRSQSNATGDQIQSTGERRPFFRVWRRFTPFESDLGIILFSENPPGSAQPDKGHRKEGQKKNPGDYDTDIKNH